MRGFVCTSAYVAYVIEFVAAVPQKEKGKAVKVKSWLGLNDGSSESVHPPF